MADQFLGIHGNFGHAAFSVMQAPQSGLVNGCIIIGMGSCYSVGGQGAVVFSLAGV